MLLRLLTSARLTLLVHAILMVACAQRYSLVKTYTASVTETQAELQSATQIVGIALAEMRA